MSAGPAGSAREAAERNAAAVMSGNLAQVMADITPEAMAQMMQMAAQAQASGVATPTTLPQIRSYDIETLEESAEVGRFRVSFVADAGSATVETTWRPVLGQWRIASVTLIDAQVAEGGSPPATA